VNYKMILLSLVGLMAGCTTGKFVRQETFPEGETFTIMNSYRAEFHYSQFRYAHPVPSNTQHLICISDYGYVFTANVEKVWSCTKIAALDLEKTGQRPVTKVDEEKYCIRNSSNEETVKYRFFFDDFETRVEPVNETQTRVTVKRRVFRNNPSILTLGAASNGKIENWILTRIQDEMSK
jgi:hypothetical protein